MILPFFWIEMKTDIFQSCDHCWVFQTYWQTECSTLTASCCRISNSTAGITSPPLALLVVMLIKAHLISHSRMSGYRWVTTPSSSLTERLQWIKRKNGHIQPIHTDSESYEIWNLLALSMLRGFERNIFRSHFQGWVLFSKYLVSNYGNIVISQNSVQGLSISLGGGYQQLIPSRKRITTGPFLCLFNEKRENSRDGDVVETSNHLSYPSGMMSISIHFHKCL